MFDCTEEGTAHGKRQLSNIANMKGAIEGVSIRRSALQHANFKYPLTGTCIRRSDG